MKKRLAVFTVMHFAVDFATIFRMIATVLPQAPKGNDWLVLMIVYNFCAFALPAFLGLLSDVLDSDFVVAGTGCLLAGLARFAWSAPLLVTLLAGVGNGLFHVGAGRRVLTQAEGRYADSGIFICSGAFGVFLGTSFGRTMLKPFDLILTAAMFAAAAVLFAFRVKEGRTARKEEQVEASLGNRVKLFTLPVFLLLAVVVLRSYYGTAVKYSWNNTFILGLLFTACIAAGKALGGIAADKIGVRAASVISLGGAAVTVLFSARIPAFGFVSILLFNMTMPLTLALLAGKWKNLPGFAFGILMLALFIGIIPALLVTGGVSLPVYGLCILSLVSLGLLLAAEGKRDVL